MKRWFVAATRPHQEAKAAEHLERQSFEVWVPRMWRTRRHARRFDTVLSPLFPGYVFVKFDPKVEPWRCINGTFGVRYLISGDRGPSALPDTFVDQLKSRSEDGGLVEPKTELQPGAQTRIVSGPFVDCIGTIVGYDSAARVRLLLSVLGGAKEAVLPSAAIAPVV